MIFINIKALLVIVLLCISFVNNFLLSFDTLKEVNNDTTLECFLVDVNQNVEIEKPFWSYLKTIYQYVVYFIFFYNTEDLYSIIEIMNYE